MEKLQRELQQSLLLVQAVPPEAQQVPLVQGRPLQHWAPALQTAPPGAHDLHVPWSQTLEQHWLGSEQDVPFHWQLPPVVPVVVPVVPVVVPAVVPVVVPVVPVVVVDPLLPLLPVELDPLLDPLLLPGVTQVPDWHT